MDGIDRAGNGAGKRWLITGCSSGFGRAVAAAALARGDRVAGTLRNEADRQAFEALAPGRARGLLLDLRNSGAIRPAAEAAAAWMGGIDRLVNNAGYCLAGAIEEARGDEIRAQMEVNFFGAVEMIQAVLVHMRAQRSGHIVNITSISGIASWMGIGHYCASKHALEAVGKALAQEVGPLGIHVTNVAPGAFRTGFNQGGSLTRSRERIADYDPTAGLAWSIMQGGAGHEAGDPARAAEAILRLCDHPRPPLHLLLGSDAVHYHGRQLAAQVAEIADWMPVTIDVNHADVPPGLYGTHG